MRSLIRRHRLAALGATAALLGGLAWLAFGFFGIHTLWVDNEVAEALPTFSEPATDQSQQADITATTATPANDPLPPATTTPAASGDLSPSTTATPSTPTPTAPPATGPIATAPSTTAPPTTVPAPTEIVVEQSGVFTSGAHPTSGDALVLGNGTAQRFLRFENFATDNGPDLNVYLVNSSTGDVSDFIDLGDLTGNIGDQNYEIPADVDLSVYDQVNIWCVRFGVSFGSATLTTA